ncbi:hypothetical protein [Tatumella citrea]|uniref:Uncharacterized protein n=1 Tax=Tatumella citrea TaxID=53336 RepID=A0A1Y0L967_TATCI|nr:hypothetical protein [Tatumella citrea]ARU94596.1 hypothetical protein A7K98_13000 [Tatumella citrea]ARU98634.1 hypothetical protein A7K99_12990 [Tatumella citrea]
MTDIPEDRKYCYRYVDGNDSEGRPVVMLWKRVIIRETEKTFWHVSDMPMMSFEQLVKYWTGGNKERQKKHIKRCSKGGARSRYHYTKTEALSAFIYRKTFQLSRIRLTAETVELCLKGLREAGYITYPKDENGYTKRVIAGAPDSETFLAADEPGPIADTYSWGDY